SNVEPVETPAFIEREKISQISGPVPVVLLGSVTFDLGHPVDQLVSGTIDVIDDRIDHHLTREDRADAHVGLAAENRLAPRHPAPGINAGKDDLVVRVELLAQSRVNAVAGD